ncbi:RNase H family protein [Actinocorallia sp. B10E7]|uniref:ribonuclease HI n=1 Tax=Actinocorallia sp. B10E7 TaxID=3153558 RepID=UPI00325EE5E2
MTATQFRCLLACLPDPLTARVVRLQRYVLVSLDCTGCQEVGVLLKLALLSARAGDLPAAETVLHLAERTLRALAGHDHTFAPPRITRLHRPRPRPARSAAAPSPGPALAGQVARWTGTRPLVAATDASWKRGHGGMGFLTTDGRWGIGDWKVGPQDPTGPSKIIITELRAVQLLLSTVEARVEMTVLIDSLPALSYLWRWQSGDVSALPPGYEAPHLRLLARRVADRPRLRFQHVKGHSGHLLNEAADSLAAIARRRAPGFDVEARASDLVDSFLTSWNQQISA